MADAPLVPPTVAAALRSEALFTRSAIDGVARGREVRRVSPFVTRTASGAEALRVARLLKGPLVRDRITVPGARRDLIGKCVTLGNGPAAGEVSLVIGFEEAATDTVLRVLRRLT